jgi:glycosyltransferase involved in cell wall biosynthesis
MTSMDTDTATGITHGIDRNEARADAIRVLCIDYSLGFGGATKSMALMLRDMPGVVPIIVTSQDPDLRRLWYGQWSTYRFRRLVNYRSRWRYAEWLQQRSLPAWLQAVAMKLYTLLDAGVSVMSVLWIAFLARRHRADVLHLANGFVPPEALLAGRLAGVPSIAHLRGFYSRRRGTTTPSWSIPTLVIGDSHAVTDSFRNGCSAEVPTTTIHEVVDVPRFDETANRRDDVRASWGLAPDQVAVGLLGRVVPWKGQREFTLAMIAAMHRNEDLVGLIIGDASDGTQTYFNEVRELIHTSGMEHRFILTGYVADVEPLYGGLDVVVHASIEPEPCGMVVMEAMAARRPVIAADAGGPRELVRTGIDGWLVEPGNVEGMTDAILALAVDPAERERMGESGYERALQLYDIPVATARLRAIYGDLVSGADLPASLLVGSN